MNRVILCGRLGTDPELRYTQQQTAVCNFSMATTEYMIKDGQKQELTEWHKVVVWSKVGENCKKFLRKGSKALVEGKVQTRSWDDTKTGQKRYATEIIAQNVQFLDPKSDNPAQPSDDFQVDTGSDLDNIPF